MSEHPQHQDQQDEKSEEHQGRKPQQSDGGDSEAKKPGSTPPEIATLAVSSLVVLGLIGFLLWHGVKTTRVPDDEAMPMAAARVQTDKAQERDGFWAVPIEVRNVGNVPLEEVNLTVEWTDAKGEKAEADLSFNFVAENATEDAFIVVDQEPEKAKPEVTVRSFKTQRDAHGY